MINGMVAQTETTHLVPDRGCLFCKSLTNSFSSVEHIFPESLGNTEKILPRGVVCDKCNNEVLALLDQALVEFDPILFFRTVNGVESKRGKVPDSPFENLHIANPNKHHVSITVGGNSRKYIKKTEQGFNLEFRGRKRMDARILKPIARALYKITLELIYLDHGSDLVFSPRFDEVREIILGARDFSGYLLIGTSLQPENGLTYRFFKSEEEGKEFTVLEFKYFLLRIITDLERRVNKLENGTKLVGFTNLKF